MSQLILLRHTLQNKHLFFNTYFQYQHVKKSSQCKVLLQKVKRTVADHELQLSKRSVDRADVSTDVRPLGKKIKENTETLTYTTIILVGVGATAIMFWTVFRELFSSSSPSNIYSNALDRVIEDTRVQDSLGAPIKGFGEESRRGRRQHVAHSSFKRNGVPHILMKFYVQGIRNKATVHLEYRLPPTGPMEYRYLFVQLDHYPHTIIILEDNRASDEVVSASPLEESNQSFVYFDGKN